MEFIGNIYGNLIQYLTNGKHFLNIFKFTKTFTVKFCGSAVTTNYIQLAEIKRRLELVI